MRPPTMGRPSSTSARSRLASQCGAAVQSESMKATISPRAASIPWFLELSAPVCGFSTIRTDGNCARTLGTVSSVLPSSTTITSTPARAGAWASTDSRHLWSGSRSSWVTMMTLIVGRVAPRCAVVVGRDPKVASRYW